MNKEDAIRILTDELKHTEFHLQDKNKAPEFYQEMKDWCEALKLGVKALKDERPQGEKIKKKPYGWVYCSECDSLLEPQDKFCWNCGAKMKGGAE